MIALRCSAMFDGERFVTGGVTVVVDGGVIAGAQAGHPDIGPNIEVVEYPDATVLPGLIDTHVHLVADGGRRALDLVEGYTDDEVDAVMSRSLAAQLAAGVDRRDRQRSGSATVVEPTILASGPPLTTPGGHCHYMGGEVAGPAQIEA